MIRNDATQAQVIAARPDTSTWLMANAGSGKTRVLTDRVARLLLADVPPEKILCLTYTKAAASEMQNRLFERLGAWAMTGNAELEHALRDLGFEGILDDALLRKARSLFAQAIETPGGLKIQTIHAFCAAILRRFPLEARVSPQFTEMDDRSGTLLRTEIVQDMAAGPEAPLVDAMARLISDSDFSGLTSALSHARDRFADQVKVEDIATLLGVPHDAPEDWAWADVVDTDTPRLLAHVREVLSQHQTSKTMQPIHAGLASLPMDASPREVCAHLKPLVLTKKMEMRSNLLVKAAKTDLGADADHYEALAHRVMDAHQREQAQKALRNSVDVHRFARVFLDRYAAAKEARGWLDFDDLILKTRALLEDERVAAWVLFRLDGGIDHILVDEAQDTSPRQWDVIERLAQEFTSGSGARANVARTIFVVGDKKQSIYSFQGADPREFDTMRDAFQTKLETIQAPFQDAALQFSFRSAPAILSLVDQTFEGHANAGFHAESAHRAFKSTMPGRVDLWPVVPKTEVDDDRHWTDTVDHVDASHENVRLANSIAARIKRLLAGGDTLPDKEVDGAWIGRPIEPRDILILVQRRSALFSEIIRACKTAELPIAGSDRLKVGAELAVRDIAALLSWIALPEDDLSLAVVLKSPLVGWSEQQLFDLAHGRGKSFLWRQLEAQSEQHVAVWDMLKDLRDSADFLRPYDLLERILIHHNGRARLLARLGYEAEDGINALLDQALTYETTEIPSLTGFLMWMETDDLEVKRQPDAASNQIRVMTVHGAKGLEAPIVILPDCAKYEPQQRDKLLPIPDTPLWKPVADAQPPVMRDWLAEAKDRQAQERSRLLYVAMTRAENWLIVAAAGDLGSDGNAWHSRIGAAMEAQDAVETDFGVVGTGLRFANGNWPTQSHEAPSRADVATPEPLPTWLHSKAPDPQIPDPVGTPTGLGGAKALPGEAGQDEDAAKAYGTEVHRWLETLADHPQATSDGSTAFEDAHRVFTAPHLTRLFAGDGLSEVDLSAFVPVLGKRLHGTIDRLIAKDDEVWAIDYKTNATTPTSVTDVPDGLLRQMGAYAHMLTEIYPDRHIRTAILWTRTAELMELPHDLVTEALAHTT